MRLPDGTIEKACGLATGCIVVACGAGPIVAAAAGTVVAGAGLLELGRKFLTKHGLDSDKALDKIQRQAEAEARKALDSFPDMVALNQAAAALDRHLGDCLPDRDALIAASFDEHGFPARATELVLLELARAAPDSFGPRAQDVALTLARTVIGKALHAAIETPEYFALLEPHLVLKQNQFLARIDRVGAETRADVAEILALLKGSRGLGDAQAAGATEDQIYALLTRFVEGGLNLEQVEAELPKSAILLRALAERLGRLSNDEPEIAAKLQAAKAAIDAADLDLADRLLAEAEAADLEAGERRILRAVETITDRADLAASQARYLEAADLHGRAAQLAEPYDRHRAWKAWIARASAFHTHGEIHPGLETLRAAVATLEEKALPLAPRETTGLDWALTKNRIGNVLHSLGSRAGGEDGINAIKRAVDAYSESMAIYTQREYSSDWAATKNNIGTALYSLSQSAAGEAASRALRSAIDNYSDALTFYTKSDTPAHWTTIKNNLGNALRALGQRVGGKDGIKALKEGVNAVSETLEIRTRKDMPAEWASTKRNLGISLRVLGERSGGEDGIKALKEAVDACSDALEVYTRKDMPVDWAITTAIQGSALSALGDCIGDEGGNKVLNQAIGAYSSTLEVYTRKDMPVDWAGTKHNLGVTLKFLGERAAGKDGIKALNQAVEAYADALEVYTRKDMPADWAMTQNSLGNALRVLGERAGGEDGIKALNQAVDAYSGALKVRTRKHMPAAWAKTTANQCLALAAISKKQSSPEPVCGAVARMTGVIEVFTTMGAGHYIKQAHSILADMTDLCRSLGGTC